MRQLLFLSLLAACGSRSMYAARQPTPFSPREPVGSEDYHDWGKNPWIDAKTDHLSTYAGDSRVILPRTSIDHKDRILAAIEHLQAGGSTAMASGIDTAYEIAASSLKPGTVSRVIVCTDGDANVGPHSHEEILKIIEG